MKKEIEKEYVYIVKLYGDDRVFKTLEKAFKEFEHAIDCHTERGYTKKELGFAADTVDDMEGAIVDFEYKDRFFSITKHEVITDR